MRSAAVIQALAFASVPLFHGAAAAPVTDTLPDYNTTDATLVGRSSRAPCVADDAVAREILLHGHNTERLWHHAPPLEWDETLASYAQEWANKCTGGHSSGPYGENLYGVGPSSGIDDWHKQTKAAMHAWIGEVSYFPWHDPDFTMKTGHFSQIIWKDSKKIGCAWSTDACGGPDGFSWLFCEFQPAGNVLGAFKENTLPH